MKMLIAEDDPVSALALRRILERQGYEVTVCTDGAQAWDTWQQGSFPIVILDWMMPYIDGLEVCRRIRAQQDVLSYTCIIMLTAKQTREDRARALNEGVDVFLTKPLSAADLIARLQVAERILGLEQENPGALSPMVSTLGAKQSPFALSEATL